MGDTPGPADAPLLWGALVTGGKTWAPAHLRLLDRKLREVAEVPGKRLLVSMPPRHGKSQLASRFFPAWYLGRNPDKRIILASYEAEFAASWGRKVRDGLEEHGRAVFGVGVRGDSRAAHEWEIDGHEGGMTTAGAGGGITGRGAHVLLVDDPLKNAEEAFSRTIRNKQDDWFASTAETRLEPGGSIVLVQTRWHEDDLAGRQLRAMASGGQAWDVLCLPALAEAGDPLGRPEGAPLWPARYPVARLEEIRDGLAARGKSRWWSALYQQRPSLESGGLFQRTWLRHYRREEEALVLEAPDGTIQRVATDAGIFFATVDLATSLGATADWTVLAVWQSIAGWLLLRDLVRMRAESPGVKEAIRAVASRWRAVVWIERVGYQKALIQDLRAEGSPVRELDADRDKVARALAATPLFESGRVWFPSDAPWGADLESELLAFPAAPHDDQVDAVAYACRVAQGLARAAPEPPVVPDRATAGSAFRNAEVPAAPRGWEDDVPTPILDSRPGSLRWS